MTYDILIIGAGTAGMACAVTAAERGLRVGVLEKSDRIGGALHWSGGHMSAGGTRLQQRKGISDSPEDHLSDIFRINKKTGDHTLIKMAVEEAPHTIDWLEELGFDFAPEAPRIIYGHAAYTKARTHYGTEKAMSIYKVLLPLWNKAVESGQLSCHFHHEFIDLDQHNGRFDTVICHTPSGVKTYQSRHIVVTSGGYGSNPAYFGQKHPGVPLMSSCYPTATGDGHRILEEHQAQFRMGDFHLPSLGGIELEEGSGRCDFNRAWAMVLTSVYRQPRDIYVNAYGKRFMPEDEIDAEIREHAVMQQPGWYFWVVFDEKALTTPDANGVDTPIIIGWTVDQIKAEAEKNRALYIADTIATLAEKTGLPTEALQDTVQHYNEMVVSKQDADFGRTYLEDAIAEPPFYALKVHASVLVTFGGIRVSKNLEVLDQNAKVMPGLYAAGEVLGLGATSGGSFCSGMAITPALSFGRMLGRILGR
ncbi:MAG: FAD-dependent oxidoreductase [Bacteroidota bacterium]